MLQFLFESLRKASTLCANLEENKQHVIKINLTQLKKAKERLIQLLNGCLLLPFPPGSCAFTCSVSLS